MNRKRSNGDSKLVKAMRKCQSPPPPTVAHPAATPEHPRPWILSYVSYRTNVARRRIAARAAVERRSECRACPRPF